ncbi:MAG TPA: alpha-amylase family glycosyl hydrolase [Acidobacteriaceae bacterium]|jgi:glycosidase|nr:alpha-amylase family glycosyl hydrolase [Acidobacteriaceae bacterium]
MEFHISRAVRDQTKIDDLLFSYTGNVVFANVTAARKLAQALNEARGADVDPAKTIHAGALYAMGLIDELNHALIARYRKDIDPAVLREAFRWLTSHAEPAQVDRLLREFSARFPNTPIYRGEVTVEEWLAQSTEGMAHREAALEELLLLWLANINPAFKPFRDLYADTELREKTIYGKATETLPEYFNTRPKLAPEVGSLLDALRAPMLASPESLTGQLDFIRVHWTPYLGKDLKRVLLAIDTLREEDLAIWLRFHPPGPDWHRHGAPGRGGEGFVGDEYIGFEDQWITDASGRRRRYSADYQAPLNEYEAFSADQAWMPNVVMLAKSTYVWLEQLSKRYGRHIHRLDHIPDEELRALADRGMTALWLIGLWERSVASRTIKRLRGHSDAVASAYSLKRYEIAEDLGGDAAYENLRHRAAHFGLRLASDMVPNHMGIDADWVIEHPDWFLSRWESPFPSYSFNGPDLSTDSRVEIKIEDHYYDQSDAAVVFRLRHHADGATRYMYHGNDGTTFAWNDTAQMDYSKAHVREQVIQAILHVARLFPIIRFDAAMVLAKRHVQRLWFPLPGAGGSIPSRAENAMSQEEFDALMPHEFWREVVDRVAAEVPGTLLLAEAFWLLEGYFVRTLGMHRVYNSAFMNMLRDEENAKYRSYLKKTIEFDPDILKRYVNFMSNPDERTAIDQFGSDDKYFGVATLLATLPGLPMFGHGQVEGYTERYGMEYKQAKMEEWPNEGLVARHMHEIAPLLKRRRIFAESANFVLYDFWTDFGTVDENVFAYSNRNGSERSIVLYNNSYGTTHGTLHISAAAMDKGSGELRQRSLADGLGVGWDESVVLRYRDHARGLEYLRRATDIHRHGLTVDLRGYQYEVLLDWHELRSTAEQPWDRLCDSLNGAGVYSLDHALSRLRLRPLHEALEQALHPGALRVVAELGRELLRAGDATTAAKLSDKVVSQAKMELPKPAARVSAERAAAADEAKRRMELSAHEQLRLADWMLSAESFGWHASEILKPQTSEAFVRAFRRELQPLVAAALRLPVLEREFTPEWPAAVRSLLPSCEPGAPVERTWAPVLAWALLRSLPDGDAPAKAFDQLQLREALGAIFSTSGLEGEDVWRGAARVRVLLAHGSQGLAESVRARAFWDDADVRWLAGVNESDGRTYFNQEATDELLTWMALPSLVRAAESSEPVTSLRKIEEQLAAAREDAKAAGFELEGFLSRPAELEPREHGGAKADEAVAKPGAAQTKAGAGRKRRPVKSWQPK